MKKIYSFKAVLLAVLLASVSMAAVVTTGCLVDPSSREKKSTPVAGKGSVYLSIIVPESSRTLFPTGWENLTFSVKFTAAGKSDVTQTLTGGSGTVTLETGTWQIDIEAKSGNTVAGVATVTDVLVEENKTTNVTAVRLLPKTGGAAGTVSWSVEFPNEVTSAVLKYYDANEANEGQVNLLSGVTVNGNKRSGTINVAPGSWWFWTELADSYSGATAGRSDAVHVYSGLTTSLDWTFTNISKKVESVAINGGNFSLTLGNTTTLNATVQPTDAALTTVTWSSGDTNIVTVNATTGLVTPVAVGSTTITATATDGSGKSASVTVTVNYAALTSIAFTTATPNPVSFTKTNGQADTAYTPNATVTLGITPTPATANPAVTWSVAPAGVVTVSNTGVVTPAGNLAVGTYTATITATSVATPARTATRTVTVTVNYAAVTGISAITPNTVTFTKTDGDANYTPGNTQQLGGATITPATANPAVTWSSNSANVTVSNTGVVAPAANLAVGTYTATITATSVGNTARTTTRNVTVTVNPKPTGSITITVDPEADFAGLPSTLSLRTAGTNAQTRLNITLTGTGVSGAKWFVDGVEQSTGASYTLNATGMRVGDHQLTVRVTISGVLYSKSVDFTVTN